MKVVLSTPGRFHTFDLARELHSRRCLEAIFTGYPRFKLKTEALPVETWLAEMSANLDERAKTSAAAREALARLVG